MKTRIYLTGRIAIFALVIWIMAVAGAVADDTGKIPQRSDIEDQYKWRVEDIYENVEAWEADYKKLETAVPRLEQYRGHLADSPDMLYGCLMLSDSLDVIISNLYVFAYLKLDEDTRVSQYQELAGRASVVNSQLGQAQAFIRPEILAIDEATLESFLSQKQELQMYRYYLEDMLRQKKHILSEKEEAILAAAGPLTRGPIELFNMIDNADHKLGTIIDGDGNEVELTYGRYSRLLKGTDRELRRIANDTVQAGWSRYINTLATNLGASLQKDKFLADVRGYDNCLEAALDGDNIPPSVVLNLVKAVNDNRETLHKLTSLRKKMLGYDTLYTYDMSVPLVPEYERHFTYEEARDIILKGLQPLGKDYLKDVEMGLNSHWIDVYETEGKASGGYNWGTYTSHPYILLNFDGQLGEVFTLAHEMGHALHGHYSNRAEPYVYHGHSLFTAEVASTCNEAILMKYLMANARTKEEKIFLLNYYIEQIENTFITQTWFTEFELAVHERIESGQSVSVDYFRKTYRDIFQKYYGPELVIGPNNDMGGMKIYHFYRQYYVFKYATSYAAAQMLSQKILEGDKEVLDKYMKFLATGSSKDPIDILKDVGVDMTQPEAIARTCALFGELVDEMEKLLSES